MTIEAPSRAVPNIELESYPLCVDLDGTLIHTDLLHENLVFVLTKKPWLFILVILWIVRGRAYLKMQLAKHVEFDPSLLPYDYRVVNYLQCERAKGRKLVLATASIRSHADAVADHLGLFDLVLATGPDCNLKGRNKASTLTKHLQRFCYLGNAHSDLPVWDGAEMAGIANAPRRLAQRLSRRKQIEVEISRRPGGALAALKALRPYQWAKNLLVFVPIVTANQVFDPAAWIAAALAFVAFSFTASGIYVLNDLSDLPADRRHPRKRNRPFASGKVSILLGIVVAPCLAVLGLATAWWAGVFLTVALYALVSLFYTTLGKEFPLVDVFCLAFLYVVRLFAGGMATGFHVSQWLLGFSAFLFLSLAFMKRVAEISAAQGTAGLVSRRGYFGDDHVVLTMMGITSSFASCVLLALFVQSGDVAARYASPVLLWALVPLILFWQMRLWLSTTRGYMHDDPIVYAARDWVSWVASANGAAIMLVASHFKLWT